MVTVIEVFNQQNNSERRLSSLISKTQETIHFISEIKTWHYKKVRK